MANPNPSEPTTAPFCRMTPSPKPALLPHHGMGVGEEILSYVGLGVNDDMGQQGGAGSHHHPRSDHDIGPDMRPLANRGAGVNDRRRVDPWRIMRGGTEDVDGVGERQVGVRCPQGGRFDLRKILRHQDSPCLGRAGKWRVFRVGHKGQLAGTSSFNPLDPGNLLILVAMAGGPKDAGEFGKLHAGDCTGVLRVNSVV